jgi:hypothetical protein
LKSDFTGVVNIGGYENKDFDNGNYKVQKLPLLGAGLQQGLYLPAEG